MANEALERILYIEDNADIRLLARMALERLGKFTVRACSSGREALQAAGEPDYRPDLILLDVMMPDLDGPATVAQLRGLPNTAAVPFIFMTAKSDPSEIAGYRALGALGVIAKPFDPRRLVPEIRRLWEGRHE
ncbi:Response regulator receiver domain-containing protein [Noviherbaspirillum humi]|uniref:Response regulator receiver domain-containing protein n=1 Tax=Noviherbaspirillum humi TaxID=1688639 RepID=A0A239DQB2_9BURK|nr:response regulator [Noviherbaspirillum humi]SNS33784.1 Response regulator receiver domain-containing protein [Noviherbaspirillum humi]